MTNKEKQLNLLGLATRARLLATGEGGVLDDIRKQKASLVIVAEDCSEATKKKIMDKCRYYGVPVIVSFTTMEITYAIGKQRSIVAFIDKGFASSFQKLTL